MRVRVISYPLAQQLNLMRFWHEIRNRYLYVGWVDGRRFKRAVRRAGKSEAAKKRKRKAKKAAKDQT